MSLTVLLGQLGFHVAGIVEDFLDEPFDPVDVVEHDAAEFADEIGVIFPLRGELNEGLDGGQGIADFVRKSSAIVSRDFKRSVRFIGA